jgi:hypothetical protein
MKQWFVRAMVAWLVMAGGLCCSKGDGGGSEPPPPPAEENLRVSTSASGLNVLAGADFEFNVVVESKMPADGVSITYIVRGETDNQDYPQGPAIDTKTATTAVRIGGLPRQKFCVCTITVTSKSKPSNKATSSFRVVYK